MKLTIYNDTDKAVPMGDGTHLMPGEAVSRQAVAVPGLYEIPVMDEYCLEVLPGRGAKWVAQERTK